MKEHVDLLKEQGLTVPLKIPTLRSLLKMRGI